MAEAKNRIGKADSWISIGQWSFDKAVALYVFLATSGGAVMGSFAAVFAGWTPFEWASLAIGTAVTLFILLRLAGAVGAWDQHRRAEASLLERTKQGSPINPLDPVFRSETIRVGDLITPAGGGVHGKTFIGCDLIGPTPIALSGCRIDFSALGNVEAITFAGREIGPYPNKVVFSDCTFQGCRVFNSVILVPDEMAADFKQAYPGLSWLN